MSNNRKNKQSWTFYAGFVGDKPSIESISNGYDKDVLSHESLELFVKKSDALKRFVDVRRITVVLESFSKRVDKK